MIYFSSLLPCAHFGVWCGMRRSPRNDLQRTHVGERRVDLPVGFERRLPSPVSHLPFPRCLIPAQSVVFGCTVGQNSQEPRRKYWATRSSVRSFARTACSGLLVSLAPSAALTRSLARSLRSLPRSWESELLDGYFVCVFSYFRP